MELLFDNGQQVALLGLDETNGGPVPLEGMLTEEFDSTEGNGTGHPRPTRDIGAVEEILPQFLVRDQVGRLMIMLSEFADGPGVVFLAAGRETPELHVLDHSFAQSAHGRPPGELILRPKGHRGLLCFNTCRE
jgi:hypothetical protein